MVILSILGLVVGLALPAAAFDIPSEVTLFKNVNIFDGKSEELLMGYDVLVVKNLIKMIGKDITLADTYEIDVKTGGYKAVASGGHSCSLPSIVTVYEPEKMVEQDLIGDGTFDLKLSPCFWIADSMCIG